MTQQTRCSVNEKLLRQHVPSLSQHWLPMQVIGKYFLVLILVYRDMWKIKRSIYVNI